MMAQSTGVTRSGRSYVDPYTLGQPSSQPQQLQTPHIQQPPPAPPSTGNTTPNEVSGTLAAIKSMLGSVPPSTPFETNMVNCVNLLIAQMEEMKRELEMARCQNAHLSHSIRDVELSAIKTEQYSRRDCLTVTGVAQPEGESTKDLGPKVATLLSKSGVPVKADDFSACHRNGGRVKQIKLRDGTMKSIPPTITVKFKTISQKDEIVKTHKNFDSAKSKPAEVQVFHSLTPHYSHLRREILGFLRGDSAGGKSAKWVKYLSPTSGLAVKLRTDEFIKGIHTWNDFLTKFNFAAQPRQ